ncbi:MAG: cell division protein FtsA [Anaerolineae bacterium]|nr:cell division protein FtsA [Anaerolineae bacterium]
MERTIVGIDVGTTKICTLIGQVADDGALQIIGVGVAPSRGVRKGVITDLEQAAQAIGESVQKAERISGYPIVEAYIGLGGSHIASQNSRGVVAIGKGDRPVDHDDIERAMESAQAIAIPHNRRIIHSIPREFIIDGQDGIKNPLGLMGYRLEVEAHIITGAVTSIQNLVRCVEMNGVEVADLVLQPLASSEAVLTQEEKDMGVALVDMGGGTTDVAIYVDGSVWETLVFAIGGNHITNDIAVGLRTPFATAEDIKIRYAHALPSAVEEKEVIEVATFGEEGLQTIPRRELCRIVAARTEEMFDLISREIKRSGFDSLLSAGVVLTGGTANLRGVREVASRVLQLPVRIGMPQRLRGLVEAISSPAYATSVGLLLWGLHQEEAGKETRPSTKSSWGERLLEWLKVFLPRS